MLKEAIIGALVSEGVTAVKKILTPKRISLRYSKEELVSAIYQHNNYIKNTTKFISFKEMRGNKYLNKLYIDLDIELQSRRYKTDDDLVVKNNISTLIENHNSHIIILGGSGAGKTTTVNRVCQNLFNTKDRLDYSFPILINLRELHSRQSVYSKLESILGLEISIKKNDEKDSLRDDQSLKEKYVNAYLNELRSIIVLDGLDEISTSKFKDIVLEIETLMSNISNSLIILTCRPALFNMTFSNSTEYELCNLTNYQSELFVSNWFDDNEMEIKRFLVELRKSKFQDLKLRPLTLAHLCAIFERTKKFYDRPKSVYKKLVRLLIEEWDEQRRIVRESSYASFDNETKFEFLCHFAYILTTKYTSKKYTEDNFINSYKRIHNYFKLPEGDSLLVVREIEKHTGIIIKSGHNTFEFAHKSMQEYLSAEYLVKMPTIPSKLIFDMNISNELAIAISLSSDSNLYYYNLIFEVIEPDRITKRFVIEFLSRLQYENPSFKDSLLIPYSFIYIYNLLIENNEIYDDGIFDEDFEIKFSNLIKSFKKDIGLQNSFFVFNEFFGLEELKGEILNKMVVKKDLDVNLIDEEVFYLDTKKELFLTRELYYENYF